MLRAEFDSAQGLVFFLFLVVSSWRRFPFASRLLAELNVQYTGT